MKHLIFILAILFICSCKQNKEENTEAVETLEISFHEHQIKASEFIKDAEVIKLETGDQCLIQRISKIQYIKNKLYILDADHNTLLIFNKDGSFHKRLFKVGAGPGEYAQIMDFLFRIRFCI